MYLFEKQGYRERERDPCWDSFPLSGWGWANPNPEAWKSIWVSHVGERGSSTWATVYHFFRNINRGLVHKWSTWDWDLHLYGMPMLKVVTQSTALQFQPHYGTFS